MSVRPGLRYSSQSGRTRGSLSYSLDLTRHTRKTDPSEARNSLNASFNSEVLEGRIYVDSQATISQSAVSPFGPQSAPGSSADNANRVEVGTASLSPYIKGPLGSWATYEFRLNAAGTNTRRSVFGDSTTTGGSISLNSAGSGATFGWGMQANQQTVEFRAGQKSSSDRATLSLAIRPDPEMSIALRAGSDSSDFGTASRTTSTTSGGSLRWTPTERTVADLNYDERYFGRSHRLALSHRMSRSGFSFTSSRDVTNSADPRGLGRPLTLFDSLFARFAAIEPDPLLREQKVLDFIRSFGQDPNSIVGGGFVSTSVSMQQRQDLSWSYAGLRASMTLQAFSSRSTQLAAPDQLSAAEPIRQAGYTANMSYRLTPTASASLTGSRLLTYGGSVQPGTNLKSATLTLTDQLSRLISTNASLRYSTFISSSDPYRELAATVSLSLRF